MKYRAVADNKALGAKLRKDAGRVRNALALLSSAEVKTFLTTKSLTVEGFPLGEEEINVQRFFDTANTANQRFESNSDRETLVLLDVAMDKELVQEGLARELMNRIQRLRRAAGLNPTEDVDYFCSFVSDMNDQLADMLEGQREFLNKSLKRDVTVWKSAGASVKVIKEEELEVSFDFGLPGTFDTPMIDQRIHV